VERGSFFNATARTVEGFLGLIFRRDPTVKLPEQSAGVGNALHALSKEVDLLGTSLYSHARSVVTECRWGCAVISPATLGGSTNVTSSSDRT
jgi:hypothetical protein